MSVLFIYLFISITRWENDEERDVEGCQMRMPDGMPIPQLTGDEIYKYLGTNGVEDWVGKRQGQTEMRERCVADCKRVTWIIGNLPHLTGGQIRRNNQHGASTERHYRVLRPVYGHHISHGKTARVSNK